MRIGRYQIFFHTNRNFRLYCTYVNVNPEYEWRKGILGFEVRKITKEQIQIDYDMAYVRKQWNKERY